MLLSAVGMFNYMGNQEMPISAQLDEINFDESPRDYQRISEVAMTKDGLQLEENSMEKLTSGEAYVEIDMSASYPQHR